MKKIPKKVPLSNRGKVPYKNLIKHFDPNKEYLIPYWGSFAFMPKKNLIDEKFKRLKRKVEKLSSQ